MSMKKSKGGKVNSSQMGVSYEANMKNPYKRRFGDSPVCSKEINTCHINARDKVYLTR